MRLNKYLSEHGVCSRREADRLAEAGLITVNGRAALPGEQIEEGDEVLVNGKRVALSSPEKIILAVNKPAGVVCTAKRFPNEENIVDMVAGDVRLYPVGRLDKDSEGLIFLTNDGAFADEVTKASNHHEKEYEVTVRYPVTDEFVRRMEKGVYLEELDKQTSACRVRKTGNKTFTIVLTQGLNRQIRRMCKTLGNEVVSLKRVRIMNVKLDGLKSRESRRLEGKELEELLSETVRKHKDERTDRSAK